MTGYVGGAVMLNCSFLRNYANSKKYLRKVNSIGPAYEDKITTDVNDKWNTSDRFSLLYDSSGNFSLVKIRELTNDDIGTYRCAVDMPLSQNRPVSVDDDEHMDVRLRVEEGSCCERHMEIKAVAGKQLNISCRYPDQHTASPKFFCKEKYNVCRYKFTSQESGEKIQMDQYSLHDNKESKVVVVSFRNVSHLDGGQYWCGVEVNRDVGRYKMFITKISLRVEDGRIFLSSSEEVTVQVKTSSIPAGQTHGSPVVLPISVIIMLILIGIVLLMFVKCRKSRRGKESTSILTNTQDNNTTRADCDYEEIKDSSISASGHGAAHAMAQPPIDPCTDVHYSTVQLPISPGDDPTYSTVQSPADYHSEGYGYASVTFRKSLSSNDASVTLNTDELSCDYATVNCPSHA